MNDHRPDTPEKVYLEKDMTDFASKVGIIVALENGGKTDAVDAYKQIKSLYKSLRKDKKRLFPKPKKKKK